MSDVLEEIVAQANSHPAQRAVRDLERDLSYSSLIEEVARLASGLVDEGVAEGDRVALFLSNSVDFVVSALACLWVGAAFVPLSTSDPLARIETILRDSQPALAVAHDSSTDDLLPSSVVTTVRLSSLTQRRNEVPRVSPSAHRVAYVIYTSGTTGTPKGVQIGASAFGAAVRSTAEAVGFTSSTTTLCVSPFHFDGSYANLFPTLTSGGSLVIRPRESLLFPRTFFSTVVAEGVTMSGFTPSYLRLLLSDSKLANLSTSTLTTIALGGEAVHATDLESLWSSVPSLRVFNRFGPTETTIAVTNFEVTPEVIKERIVPMGRPHPDVDFYLVDEFGEVIEESNRTGELYIGGVQLMEGYLSAPELTAQVLRGDVVLGKLLYRSGDLVYRDDDGRYVYVDRADRVVKRSGVRISLLEMNDAMKGLPSVVDAACVAYVDVGVTGIVAFVVASRPLTELELRQGLLRFLPDTMMPDRVHFVEALPLNRSNKIDEIQLLSSIGLGASVADSPPTQSI